MPVFKVQYVRCGECEVEAADEEAATQAVADMAAAGDSTITFGTIIMDAVERMISSIDEFVRACARPGADIPSLFDDQLAETVQAEMLGLSARVALVHRIQFAPLSIISVNNMTFER